MKKIGLTLVALMVTLATFAQQGRVKGVVWDREEQMGIPGAVVEVARVANPDQKQHYTSGYDGNISITGLRYGEYTMRITFVGYEVIEKSFTLDRATLDLGRLETQPSAEMIEAVVTEVAALRTSQKGDTLSYNAGAFRVAADADVEGLLSKMTGITVNNGTVEVQGEEVKRVYVDGKEFFGDDVTTAIKSLPAEAVDRVEVFNKLSDQAEFSGMDDGEGYKAINIVTHSHMRQGQFGKLYAGGGYDFENDKFRYLAGGNVNIFQGESRLSIIALFNNVNQQNFSFEDILGVNGGGGGGGRGRGAGAYMVRPQAGVATVNAIGLNYSDTWGKEDEVTFQGSYFFNHTNTVNDSWRERFSEFYSEDILRRDTLLEWGQSDTRNMNHRFSARLEWKISPNQSLMSRTWFSFQGNEPWSQKWGSQWGDSGYAQIWDRSESERSGYNVSEFLQYRAKLGKAGRTITLDGNVRYQDNERTGYTEANQAAPIFPEEGWVEPDPSLSPDNLLRQRLIQPSSSLDLRVNFTYTEPLSRYSQLSLQYRFAYEADESDRRSFSEGLSGEYALNPTLSNSHTSTYTSHQVGPGFRWAKERNTIVANLYYQRSMLEGETIYPQAGRINQKYNHFTYFAMVNMQFNPENSIRLFVHSRTQEPSINNLQDVYDLSNPQYISTGNSALNPSYTHSVRLHYVHSNVTKGRTFMWMAMMNATSDYITSNVEYNKEITVDGTTYHPLQFTSPVNMNGYWWLRTHLSYGLPLNFMKCNLNMTAGVNYSITPSMMNGERNEASNIGYDAQFTLGSNISENVDFTLSWNGTYNEARNSLLSAVGTNQYFSHNASASLKWVFWKGFTLTASAAYSQYLGITNDYNEDFLLCNVYIGKKIFKNQRGEIQVGVNDLLNQNKAFARTTGSGWVQNATNSVIGRYFMVNFVFNLRHFGKKGSTQLSDYGINEGGSRRPGMGGPMGRPGGRPF
uniref:outer membrane beta-barrel protein n=1 Tax=Alistipes sp. TaxID=1872444 RepID=UPI0040571143